MKSFKDFLSYIVIIALFATAAYRLGLFNNINLNTIGDAYKSASESITNPNKNLDNYQKPTKTIRGYRPADIPEKVLTASETSRNWRNVFYADKKVVFYVYNKENTIFRDALKKYIINKGLDNYYNLVMLDELSYKRNNAGAPSSKICTHLDECLKMREKAANYALLTHFMDNCTKTICIFNPEKEQYIMLKKRKFSELKELLEVLRTW